MQSTRIIGEPMENNPTAIHTAAPIAEPELTPERIAHLRQFISATESGVPHFAVCACAQCEAEALQARDSVANGLY